MYKGILEMSMSSLLQREDLTYEINRLKGIITFRATSDLDAFSDKSNVIVYYSVLEDSKPLLLVERIPVNVMSIKALKRRVRRCSEDSSMLNYMITIDKSEDKDYIDVVFIVKNVYTNLTGE